MRLQAGARSRVAVILNPHASGVDPKVVGHLHRLVPQRDLFLSHDLEDSQKIAATVVARAYDGVLFGGGDGTFVQCLDDIRGQAEKRERPMPGVGILRLGTGNALANALGASRPTRAGLERDLNRARDPEARRSLRLLRVDGKLTPFAGCGLDAQILDDYHRFAARLEDLAPNLAPRLGPNGRYALSVGLRSLPRFLASSLPRVEVINRGGPAYRIDWRTGRVIDKQPIRAGALLFAGRVSLCSASTIPYFGLSLKMFPFVDARRDRFQLRCATASAFETVSHLPSVFRGEYRSANLHDFLCDEIEMRIERPVPVQIGGDVQPPRDRLLVRLAEDPVRVMA
jgi:diacylglycerol kinase family enzyme